MILLHYLKKKIQNLSSVKVNGGNKRNHTQFRVMFDGSGTVYGIN